MLEAAIDSDVTAGALRCLYPFRVSIGLDGLASREIDAEGIDWAYRSTWSEMYLSITKVSVIVAICCTVGLYPTYYLLLIREVLQPHPQFSPHPSGRLQLLHVARKMPAISVKHRESSFLTHA